ncbi:MAG: type II secretion system F family protein [Acidimicrobiia bacterium]|nr:type II secretion system F family protein [Acidimicrobiia bacterium]
MTGTTFLAAASVGVALAALARIVVRPTRRLGPRVRPYTVVTRSALGQRPDSPGTIGSAAMAGGGTVKSLFGPPVMALAQRLSRVIESRGDDYLALRLHQAGIFDVTPEEYRLRQVTQGALAAAAFGLGAAVVLRAPVAVLGAVVAGFTFGSTRTRSRVDRAIAERSDRIRQELYTVNQLLALHVRTGAGPLQAAQRVVDRGRGAVVEELDALLSWTRRGMREPEAFRRAAELTPEPSAARTYRLVATGAERGADLADALLALSEDLRESRREHLRKAAIRRRAAMLVPTIAILAPIMLLFIAAPLPSIVLGQR